MSRPLQASRRQAREAAVQMLYQWEVGQLSMPQIRETFWDGSGADSVASEEVRAFALELAEGVVASVAQLDPMIVEAAEHWRLERMNVLDRLILRLATYELLHQPGTPARVAINEALELARMFSGDDAVRFVNGVLDAIRRTLQRE
jgi:N utilization substance protein B